MTHYHDYQLASPEQSIQFLGHQLEQLRLSKNLSQTAVAANAGVSRRTITRMEAGATVSLDTFIRVLKVYEVADRLTTLFPAQSVRPMERVKLGGKQRKRASSGAKTNQNSMTKSKQEPWSWGDEEPAGNNEES